MIDHLTPISRGGLSTVANMRVVCVVCNTSKKDRLLDEWSPPLLVGR
ncbi:HNH endonuclease [Kitasatospora sp. HPMI-4]